MINHSILESFTPNCPGSCPFFQNISRNTQPGTAGTRSLYLSNCFRSIDTYFSQFRFTKFFSKFSKFREL
ncbi:hypothetical protein T10_2510 [Trichinella papuae]|uniref:Uncharacterized protein n=1 Tax=Trichinella papuae TaxID=268474 RepID=A0A0V1LY35_9BILA|nr:hypothetical protein T10_2510 [Trichinella papuae]